MRESAHDLRGQHLNHWLWNRNPGAYKPSKSLEDRTHPGPHQPLTWLYFLCPRGFQPATLQFRSAFNYTHHRQFYISCEVLFLQLLLISLCFIFILVLNIYLLYHICSVLYVYALFLVPMFDLNKSEIVGKDFSPMYALGPMPLCDLGRLEKVKKVQFFKGPTHYSSIKRFSLKIYFLVFFLMFWKLFCKVK